jgi:hypothetical protein
MKSCVVLIPIHSEQPSKAALLSFKQCYKVLSEHDTRIIAPEGLNISVYKEHVPEAIFVFIDPDWLSSVRRYNDLKMSAYFYDLLKPYDFLLTYELDAWVFRDELAQWCNKAYDYIGAPWFDGWHEQNEAKIMIGAGNSGFSLRSISKCRVLLKRIQRLQWLYQITRSKGGKPNRKFLWVLQLFSGYFKIRSTRKLPLLLKPEPINEDDFWCNIVSEVFSDFNVAPVAAASRFSFEANPAMLYAQNDEQLPFGCHAWQRYDPLFWTDFIPFKN